MAVLVAIAAALGNPVLAQPKDAAPPANPFAPPKATVHLVPDRDYDLLHVAVNLDVDYPARHFEGTVVNRISALRDGMQTIKLHCGKNLEIHSCSVGPVTAAFTRADDVLLVVAPKPLARGETTEVTVRYAGGGKKERGGIMADSGLHWIEPNKHQPSRVGFWTQGEPDLNRQWVPTWDSPDRLATTETRVTVPADWTVIGNGTLQSNRLSGDGKTRTFHWKMSQPHATYLLSLVAGPLDVKTVKWRGVPLMYVAPKGMGKLLDSSFGDTPEMLSFFSDITGVKYPWPKYAEDAMFDFGGGMENVSATTLGARDLTDPREGDHTMAGINAHELAHQWFGDLVTCRDWGNVWLNESFATFFEALYTEHARGAVAYAREIDGDMQGYFGESRRYKRPIATNLYPDAGAMFDAHTYPKGAAVLHTLRRMLGDKRFFAGLHAYLEAHKHMPVETRDLCRSMTEATGVNLEPFFDQWIFKPGHPVLDTTWTWDDAAKRVVLTVRQTQDTKDGTPIYNIHACVGLIADGKVVRQFVDLSQPEQTFRLEAPSKPDAVLLDPDHDFLREIPTKHWSPAELPVILAYAPNPVDRSDAAAMMLAGTPSDAAVRTVADAVRADTGRTTVFDLTRLGELKREDLRPLFRSELGHAAFSRREQAIRALGLLPKTAEDTATLAALVNGTEPYGVIAETVTTLAAWDARANMPVLKRAAEMPSLHERIRAAAYAALANAHSEEGIAQLVSASGPESDPDLRQAALRALGKVDAAEPRTREALRAALADPDFETVMAAVRAIGERKDKALLPALRSLKANPPPAAAGRDWFPGFIDETIATVEKP
jgi:aminopeptidase N